MVPLKDANDVASFLCCSRRLEKQLFELYKSLAHRVRHPLIKSLLLYVAYDSLKHSAMLQGMSSVLPTLAAENKDCAKHLGGIWRVGVAFSEEVAEKEEMDRGDLALLAELF